MLALDNPRGLSHSDQGMPGTWKRQQVMMGRLLHGRRPRTLRVRPGVAPGTLDPSDAAPREPARLAVMNYTERELLELEDQTIAECVEMLDRPGVTWINVDGLGEPSVLARLGERLTLHPLALEDAMNASQRPKVESYTDHYFLVLRTVRLAPEIEEEQVSLFFGRAFVITVQERAGSDVFEPVRERIRKDRGRIRAAGADYLAYSLVDAVVDEYFPVLERLGEQVDRLEDEILVAPGTAVLAKIQGGRRELQSLRRTIWPMREAVLTLQREESELIAAETRVFLRDCYDHAVQALEVVEAYRETAAELMEIYVSMQNQRLNEVMKVLSAIATLFIPLTFVASIYGMNFKHMPELEWVFGYPAALGLMAMVAAGLLAYFKYRDWW